MIVDMVDYSKENDLNVKRLSKVLRKCSLQKWYHNVKSDCAIIISDLKNYS